MLIQPKLHINVRSLVFVLFYGFDMLHLVFMQIIHENQLSKIVATLVLYVFLLVSIMKKNSIKTDAILLIAGVFTLFLLTAILNPEYRYAMFQVPTWNIYSSVFTFSSGIFAYLFFRMIDDPDLMMDSLRTASYVTFMWAVLRIISSMRSGGFQKVFENGIVSTSTYDMSVGYRLLFSSIIFFLCFKSGKKKLWYLSLSVTSAILMAIFGSRSAVASLLMFGILYMIFYQKEKYPEKKIIKNVMLVSILGVGYYTVTNKQIMMSLSNGLASMGLNSRMLNTLVAGSVSLDLGRNRMWTDVINIIKEHPIFGAGVYADRAMFGIYCHQLILEIFLNFGIILGIILLGIMVAYALKMLVFCKNPKWKLIFIVFFSLSAIRLNISSSFWQDTNFWACVAIVVNNYFDEKKRRIEQDVTNGI